MLKKSKLNKKNSSKIIGNNKSLNKRINKNKKNSINKDKSKFMFFLILGTIVIVLLFLCSLVFLLMQKSLILGQITINTTLGVSDYIGLNKDTDKLHFGTGFPGGRMAVLMNVSSSSSGYIYVTCDGGNEYQFTNWVYVKDQGMKVDVDEVATLNFEGRPPSNASFGKYESTMRIYILKKAKLSCFDKLFLKGDLIKSASDLQAVSANAGGGKIMLTIVNQTVNLTSD
ncbi:MAG: hypothetical protein WC758_04545 [Candidatus Woesearchaeota archaeon]